MNASSLYTEQVSGISQWEMQTNNAVIFLGGIPLHYTENDVLQYLIQFDQVRWLKIEKDPATLLSLGYAHAIMMSLPGHQRVLQSRYHTMGGIKVEIIPLQTNSGFIKKKEQEVQRKVFVKRLNKKTDDDSLYQYFIRFGDIEKAEVRRDHKNKCSRGIAYVLFRSKETAEKVLEIKNHVLDGEKIKCLKCQSAKEKKDSNSGSDEELKEKPPPEPRPVITIKKSKPLKLSKTSSIFDPSYLSNPINESQIQIAFLNDEIRDKESDHLTLSNKLSSIQGPSGGNLGDSRSKSETTEVFGEDILHRLKSPLTSQDDFSLGSMETGRLKIGSKDDSSLTQSKERKSKVASICSKDDTLLTKKNTGSNSGSYGYGKFDDRHEPEELDPKEAFHVKFFVFPGYL